MDVLTNERSQNFIVDYYAQSGEIQSIDRAILHVRRHPQKTLSMKSNPLIEPSYVLEDILRQHSV